MTERVVLMKEGSSGDNWARVQDSAQNAVVQLFVQVAQFNWLEPYKIRNQYERRGSGFFISDEGYLITTAHIINEATVMWIHVPSFGKKSFFVEVIGFCPERDLALLRLKEEDREFIRAKIGKIPWLPLGDSDMAQRTENVLVLGYPLGQYRLKSATGIISGRDSSYGQSLLQITAPVNPGNSGGPLLNMRGEVVGITIAMVFSAQNVGYAIPINNLKLILDDLYHKKLVRRGIIGLRFNYASDEHAKFLGNPIPSGFYINRVFKNSLAQQAGLQEGDMLYTFNGFNVDAYGDAGVPWSQDRISINDLIARLRVGDDVHLVIYRQGNRQDVRFTFTLTVPYPVREMYPDYENIEYEIIGGMVIMLLADNHIPLLIERVPYLIDFTRLENKVDSVLIVTHILPGSQVQQGRTLYAGCVLQYVNGMRVKTIEDFRIALQESVTSDFFTIKTADNIFVAFSLRKILKDEIRLSQDFVYQISPTVRILIKSVGMEI